MKEPAHPAIHESRYHQNPINRSKPHPALHVLRYTIYSIVCQTFINSIVPYISSLASNRKA